MAYNVNFLKGTAESFANLATKNVNTFYYIDETDLYIGNTKITNGADLLNAVNRIAQNESDIEIIKAQLEDLTGGEGNGDSSVTDLISALSARVGVVESDLSKETARATAAEGQLTTDLNSLTTRVNELSNSVTANKTDADQKITDLTTRVAANETNISKHQASLDSVMQKATANETNISTMQGNISDLEHIVDTLVGEDTDKSVRAIAIEVLVEQLLADGNTENFETLQQLAAWLADHPEEAAEMNLAIQQNAAAIEALQSTVGNHTATIEELQRQIENLQSEDGGLLSQSKEYTDTQITNTVNLLNDYKTTNDAILGDFDSRITANEEAIAAINNSTSGLLAQAQAKIKELQDSLGTAAYKNVEDFDAAGSAAAALVEAKSYTDAALTWGQIETATA